jgi:hypothetical protein
MYSEMGDRIKDGKESYDEKKREKNGSYAERRGSERVKQNLASAKPSSGVISTHEGHTGALHIKPQ